MGGVRVSTVQWIGLVLVIWGVLAFVLVRTTVKDWF